MGIEEYKKARDRFVFEEEAEDESEDDDEEDSNDSSSFLGISSNDNE